MSETTGMTANPWPSSDWMATLSERGGLGVATWGALVAILLLTAAREKNFRRHHGGIGSNDDPAPALLKSLSETAFRAC